MNFFQDLDQVIFSIAQFAFTLRQLIVLFFALLLIYAIYKIVVLGVLPLISEREVVSEENIDRVRTTIKRLFWPLGVIVFLRALDLDLIISQSSAFTFRISTLIFGIVIIQVARIFDWVSTKLLMKQYQISRGIKLQRKNAHQRDISAKATKTVKYIVYTVAIIGLVSTFNLNVTLINIPIKDDIYPLRVNSLFVAILIFLTATLLAWIITQLLLFSYYRRNEVDPGKRFAINQLVTYFIYVIALFAIIDNFGIQITVLWGGIAALMVGIGLGMQDIFRDFVSGIILLSDRTVVVHDIVTIDGQIGEISKIGLRTSFVLGRDDTMLIIPNSKLISDQIVNWTQQDNKVRFSIRVGVAYGTDPRLVKRILLEAVEQNDSISTVPPPFVRFKDFGDSSLDFEVFFWSYHLMTIENVMSEVRFTISDMFAREGVAIPFPQRDIWIRSTGEE